MVNTVALKRVIWCLGSVGLISGPAKAQPLVEGQVRLASGEPASGTQVMLFDLSNLRRIAAATTDENGWFALSPEVLASSLPEQFHLGQNYPNPFNPSTTIPFQLPVSTRVRLEVFNLLGQRVATLVDGELPAGFHAVRWDGTDGARRPVGTGVYLYRLQVGGKSETHRMVLVDGHAGVLPLPGHGGLSTTEETVLETGASVHGLVVSSRGLVPYVDPGFRLEGGRGPVDIVVEEASSARGKVAESPRLLGDVDNNGRIDIVDALLVMVYSLDFDPPVTFPSNVDLSLGDVNLDGRVDISDALSVLAYLVDPLDPSLPPGIGEPAGTAASLSPDPATVSFQPDGAWHQFTVHSTEPVEASCQSHQRRTKPGNNRPRRSVHSLPPRTDRQVRPQQRTVRLSGSMYGGHGYGRAAAESRTEQLLRTYTIPVGGAARMYWTGHDVRMVRRADVDGSNIQDLVATGAYSAGLALDLAAGKMYWTDVGTGRINRADLDGSNTQHLITTEVGSINWLALDVPGGKMYWTDWTTDKIQRANLDGSGIEDLVTTGLTAPHGLALDPAAGKMYWTDNGAARIQRADLDGSGIENLVTAGLGVPRGLALDVAAGKMYWTDAGTHKIQRANLDGSNVEDLVTSGVNAPHGLALDPVRGWMYWTDLSTNKIQRANLDGSNVEDLVTSGLSRPWGLALDTSYTGRAGGATLSPDPSTIAIENDGSWHEFRVRTTEPVVVVSNPGGTTPRVGSSDIGGASSECPAESEEDVVRRDGESIYLAGCGAGAATVELRRASDRTLLRTYTFAISEPLPAPTGTLASKMYWTSPGKIQRADRDGSNVEDLVAFGSPRGLALDMLAGKMYWTDTGTRKIWRADLDGSQAESLISSGLISPVGLALDVDAGKMYWTDTGSNRIQRANLDGSRIEYLVSLGLHSPEGLALDADGGKIYWSDYGTNKIQRANLDGSQVEDLVTTGLSSPEGLALDVEAGKMYWADFSTDKIQRANLDGSNVEDLVTTGLSIPKGLALEAAAGKIYWTDAGTQKIQRANLDGSQVEDLLTGDGSTPTGLALGFSFAALSPNPEATFPRDGTMRRFTVQASEPVVVVANPAGTSARMLVAESSGAFNECPAEQEDSLTRRHGQAVYLGGCTPGPATVELRRAFDQAVLRTYTVRVSGTLKMYWTNAGRRDRIQRADIDGTNVEDLVTTGLSEPIDLALDVTEGKMYWTDQGTDKIQRANLDGSNIEDLVTTLDYPVGLALDVTGGKMYWTDMNTDKIQRASLDGSQVEDLVATGLSRPRGIALDTVSGKMYWMDQGTDKIQRANLDGSNIEDLVSAGLNDVDRLALDLENGMMYWTDSGARKIQRANLDGSDVEDLVTRLGEPRGMALDLAGGRMYWTDSGTDRIQSADLAGSNIRTLVTGIVGPTSIALE